MADPINEGGIDRNAIIEEMKRRGMAIPTETARPAAPTPAASAPAQDAMGNMTGGDTPAASGDVPKDPVGRAVIDVVRGIGEEGIGAIVRGVGGAVKETGNLVKEGLDAANKIVPTVSASVPHLAVGAAGMSWLGEKVQGLYDKRETVTGDIIEGISQFVTGMVGAGKFVALPKAVVSKTGGKLVESMVRGAVVDATVFDGNDKRLANLAIEEFPSLQHPVTEFLAAKDDDPELLGRVKNALEGLVIGPVADLLIAALRIRKAAAKGDVEGVHNWTEESQRLQKQMEANTEAEALAKAEAEAAAANPKVDDPAAPKAADEAAAADGSVPKAADEVPPAKPGEEPAAPYGTDLPLPKGSGPLEFKYGDVAPKVGEVDAERTMKALQAKFSAAGKAMVDDGADFNFRTITNDDDLKAAINAVSAANEEMIRRTKGGNKDGVLTNRMLLNQRDELSDMFMVDPDRMMVVMANDASTMQQMAAKFQTYKDMMQRAVNDASSRADAALMHAPGSPEAAKASAEALHSVMIASQIQAMVKGIQTNTARTLAGMRLAKPGKLLSEGIGDYTELARRLQEGTFHSDDKKLLTQIAALKNNPKGFNKMMESTFGQKAGGAYTEWFLNALLSGPKTHIANFLGNTMMTGYQPLERAAAGMMWGSGKTTGEVLSTLRDEYVGMGMALFDSFRVAGIALKQNKSILDPGNGTKMDPTGRDVGGLSARALGLTNDYYHVDGTLLRTETTPVLSHLMDGIQTVVGIPSRLLTGGDELFKQINYRSYLYVDAARKAREAGLKDGDAGFKNFVSQEMNRGFDSNGIAAAVSPDMVARQTNGANSMIGLQQAREATFTQDLGPGVSRWLQGAANENVFVKTIVPFVRTPVNIFRFAIEHGPLAPVSRSFRADLRAGGDRARTAMAKLTMGSSFFAAGVFLADQGVITGGFSPDPEVRKGQELNGAKEYSIRIGDEYIQYNRLDPFATVLGFAADFSKLVTHIGEADADKLAKAATITLARNLASKTYVQGLTNFFNAVGDVLSGRSTTGIETFAYRTAGSVAVPSIVNAAKGDDSLREARNMLDAFRVRLPGHSKDVPAVRNVVGEVVDAPTGWLLGTASPLGYGKLKGEPAYAEMARLMGNSNRAISRILPHLGETKIDLREVTLPNGQNGYDRLQQLLWNTGVKGELDKLVTTPGYKDLSDGTPDFPDARGTKLGEIGRILARYKEVARTQLLGEQPELLKMFQTEQIRAKTEGVNGQQPRAYHPPTPLQSFFGGKPNQL